LRDGIVRKENTKMSQADVIFKKMCEDILSHGTDNKGEALRPHWDDGTPAYTLARFGVVNRYDLSEEFPALTFRKVAFKTCVDELLWIWQKQSANIHDLKGHIWDSWADESGSIGKAYGYQLGVKHIYPEGEFDQVDRILYDLKNNPASRRILSNIFNHQDLHEMGLAPCAYSMTFNVTGKKLNAILNQRSQDMLAANNWNVCQYAVLTHMFAQVSGLEAGEFVHVIADCHIYDRHIPLIKEIIKKEPLPAPKFWIDPEIKNFYDFTVDSVKLIDYQAHPFTEKIPIAV
jgi:thymidylate synthase